MRWLLPIVVLSWVATAAAHEPPTHEHALVQFRPDATEVLYELSFPKGPEAARWRIRGDLNHNGLLTPAEWKGLAQLLGATVAQGLVVRFEQVRMTLEVVDAKISPEDAGDGYEGRFRALVRLRTRALPAGARPVEIAVTPVVDRRRSVVLRLEAEGAIESLLGGRPAGKGASVKLSAGESLTARVDVQAPKP